MKMFPGIRDINGLQDIKDLTGFEWVMLSGNLFVIILFLNETVRLIYKAYNIFFN